MFVVCRFGVLLIYYYYYYYYYFLSSRADCIVCLFGAHLSLFIFIALFIAHCMRAPVTHWRWLCRARTCTQSSPRWSNTAPLTSSPRILCMWYHNKKGKQKEEKEEEKASKRTGDFAGSVLMLLLYTFMFYKLIWQVSFHFSPSVSVRSISL